ncbi:MAG: Ig-like domain-containing protein, partial [Planctomycetes bacterium]|nr:Ig-like domain-containing protein [Planctomycetota bacterium]
SKVPEYTLRLLDAQPPTVRSVSVSDTLLTDSDAGSLFGVTVVFSESMNTAVSPSLAFTPVVAGAAGSTLINPSSGSWSATNVANDTYTIGYEVADRNVDVTSVKIGVTGAKDAGGNVQQIYTAESEFEIDTANPPVSTFSPVDNATRVAWDADLAITFQEPIRKGVGDIVIRRSSDDSVVETMAVSGGQVSVSGAGVIVDRQVTLDANTSYYVEVTGGAFEDLAGNQSTEISGRTAWNFTTLSIPGVHKPFVARALRDLSFMVGRVQYDVDLAGVFDDLDIPLGDALTLQYNNSADNTNPDLVSAELVGSTLSLSFVENAVGRADLTVRARDLDDQTASDTFTVAVLSAPVAVDDIVETNEDVPIEIAVYANDIDADGMPVPNTVALVADSGPVSGTIVLDKGVFVYTPSANFWGTDAFRYTVRDNDGFFSNEATVSITVIEVNDYHNAAVIGDVNNSGQVSPQDVLIVINYINAVGFDLPPDPIPPDEAPFLWDVNGDHAVTPMDVIEVINILNDASR